MPDCSRCWILALACALVTPMLAATPASERSAEVSDGRFDDFTLPTTDQSTVSLSDDDEIRFHVLCFLGTECPLARVYGPRLQRLSQTYADQGVRFVGINSNIQDSMSDLQAYVEQHGITFPVAKDHDRTVAVQSGATRTPEVFVVDRSGTVRYQGRIDDQYRPGIARAEATVHDLRDALDELVAGEAVSRPRTEAVGCLIALPRESTADASITYCGQVARVLQKHCVECHRSGQIGPFVLDDYEEVIGWADMSLEVIDEGRMPPWHADPEHGEFANARLMPEADKEILRRWVDAGMPYGNPSQLPASREYTHGWQLPRQPDLVLEMSDNPYQIPAEGVVEYQYFVVDPGFTEDKWISAAQVIPGNSSVVHHCICFIRPPDGDEFRGVGLLGGYVPGQSARVLPEGFAQRVAAGSRIVFQMHYTPNGQVAEDVTRMGLIFTDAESVTHEVFSLGGVEQEFEIPPGAANHVVASDVGWFPRNGYLLTVTPHMHLRGKSFNMELVSDGQTTPLLRVPAYDFNWQHDYEFVEPLPLDEVDRIRFTAVFDNSADNPTNPDPTQTVTWGDQTWEEMAVTFLQVAQPLQRESPGPAAPAHRRHQPDPALLDRARDFADKYIERFDANGDKLLTPHELPDSVRMFQFRSFDQDDDGYVTRDEILSQAYARFGKRNR